MPPRRVSRNSNEILARVGDPRADQPKAPAAVAPEVHVAQLIPEVGALLQAFQGFLQLQQQVLQQQLQVVPRNEV